MLKVARYIAVGQVAVPVDERGHYLDWRREKNRRAPALTSPYGPGHFRLGDIILGVGLDYGVLPDGCVIITADDGGTRLLHPEHAYNIHTPGEALEAAYRLTETIVEALATRNVEHDQWARPADRWYFLRALGRELGVRPFVNMESQALRLG